MTEFMCENPGEFVLVELVDCIRRNNHQVAARSECVDVLAVDNCKNETLSAGVISLGDSAPRFVKSGCFFGCWLAGIQ